MARVMVLTLVIMQLFHMLLVHLALDLARAILLKLVVLIHLAKMISRALMLN